MPPKGSQIRFQKYLFLGTTVYTSFPSVSFGCKMKKWKMEIIILIIMAQQRILIVCLLWVRHRSKYFA